MRTIAASLWLLLTCSLWGQAPARGLAGAEYFWDSDPGQGNGTAVGAVDGSLDETVEALLGSALATPPTAGAHTFSVRVEDLDGNWSDVFTTVVDVSADYGNPPRAMQVVAAEYFWDTDPGKGGGTPFPAGDGNLDESVEELIASGVVTPPGLGAHVFHVRVQDAAGDWSSIFATVVEVLDPAGLIPRDAGVAQAEYFWNVDPGQGNGTPFAASDGSLDEVAEELLASGIAAPGGTGSHAFHVRVRDVDGGWSPVFTTIVDAYPQAVAPQRRIVTAEYFWNSDPGPGNGTPMLASDGSFGETVETVIRNSIPPPGAYGPHLFHVRVRDANNVWSPVFTTVVTTGLDKDGADLTMDWDSDGLDELLEYFLGTDPHQFDRSGDHIVHGIGQHAPLGPEDRLMFEVHRNAFAEDVSAEVEISRNLLNWSSSGAWVIQTVDEASFLRFFAVPPVKDEPTLFGRLRVECIEESPAE